KCTEYSPPVHHFTLPAPEYRRSHVAVKFSSARRGMRAVKHATIGLFGVMHVSDPPPALQILRPGEGPIRDSLALLKRYRRCKGLYRLGIHIWRGGPILPHQLHLQ